ncbi:hypothetical protein [Streptomyces coeruleorubidus]|uniref:hypothetical protein n=1 Tax=Streptomyces coeruleorubidus TaxID=116188 RepID=UPI0033B9B5ED
MPELTPNEQAHLNSLHEIMNCPAFDADCGDTDQLAPPPSGLPPLTDFNEKWEGVELDETIRSHSLRFIDFGAQWSTLSPEYCEENDIECDEGERELPEIHGEFFLRPLQDILSQPEGPAREVETEFQRQFLSELRVMDQTPRSGAGMITYLRLKPGSDPLEIWYSDIADIQTHPYPPGFVKMDLTYDAYLDALLLTKGTYGWQYLYTETGLADQYEIRGYLEGMLSLFPEIFPNYDYSSLAERLEARL